MHEIPMEQTRYMDLQNEIETYTLETWRTKHDRVVKNILNILINYLKPKKRLDIPHERIFAWALQMEMPQFRHLAVNALKQL